MADCKPSEKSPTGDVDLTSISNILNIILGVFGMMRQPAQTIPPPLLLIGANLRPGMSARNLAARNISRIEAETGKPMGDVFADGENVDAKTEVIKAENLVTMFQTEAYAQSIAPPGSIQIINADGTPGTNTIPVVFKGVVG